MDIEYIAKGLSPKARPYKNGFITCCPAHDDTNPSLVITPGDTEDFTVHCFAGCDWRAIKEAVKVQGLYQWEPSTDSRENFKRGKAKDDFLNRFRQAKAEEASEAAETHAFPDTLLLTPAALLEIARKLPPREFAIGPLPLGSVGFVYADAGVGKTFLLAGMAAAMAQGLPMGYWPTKKLSCAYIDAEMTLHDWAERIELMGIQDIEGFRIDTIAQRFRLDVDEFDLGDLSHMKYIMQSCANDDVIFIDSVTMTLSAAPGKSEYDPDTIRQFKPLISWAKTHNKLLILVDHSNAEGEIFGSKHKFKLAQWVIKLEKVYSEDRLILAGQFTKYRVGREQPDFIATLDDGSWGIRQAMTTAERVQECLNEGLTSNAEIAEALAPLTVRRVQQIRRSLQGKRR